MFIAAMIPEPPKIGWGPKRLRNWADSLRAFVVATRPLPSDTIDISESPEGTRIEQVGTIRDASASPDLKPFQIVIVILEGTPKIRVVESTLAGGSSDLLGFSEGDDPPYLLDPAVGKLVGRITYNLATRVVTTRTLEILTDIPSVVEDGISYVEIGTVKYTSASGLWSASNSRYGPLTAQINRIWYAAEAPFFNVIWI